MPDKERKIIAGRYEVISEIGSGGMAVVYKARDLSLKKDVAVKMLRPELMTDETMMRFQMEAKTASALLHPSLIRTLDFGINNGEPYLVMDYVDGITLSTYIRKKTRVAIAQAAGIFIQLCEAIAVAHAQGVLHRDLKSSNIILTDTDSPYPKAFVLDFGLAKRVEDPGLTQAGQLIGSPLYMSPEHARGEELDRRADIYSMGCLMFETLTGVPPIKGDTVLDTIMKQSSEIAPSLKDVCPTVPFSQQLESIVAISLKKDADQRYQSMDDLKHALQTLREFRSAQSTTRELKSPEPEVAAPDPPLALAPAFSRRFVLGCIALLVIAGGIGLLVAPMVPTLIDAIHPNSETETVTPVPAKTDSMVVSTADEAIMPGSKDWSKMPWDDGINWYQKFDIDDNDFLNYKRFQEFAYVTLWREGASVKRLQMLKKANLKGLSLCECDLVDNELEQAGKMSDLEVLLLDKNPKLTNKGFKHLFGLKKLKVLRLERTNFTDEALRGIEKLDKLEVLTLSRMPLEGDGLAYLQKLPNLKKLRINRCCSLKTGSISKIAKLKNLRILNVEGCRLTTEDAIALSTLPRLEYLDVANTNLSEAGFAALTGMKTLKKLWVGENLEENKMSRKCIDDAKSRATFLEIIEGDSPTIDNLLGYKYSK